MRSSFSPLLMLLATVSMQGQAVPQTPAPVAQSPTFLQGVPPGKFSLPVVARRYLPSSQFGCPVGFFAQKPSGAVAVARASNPNTGDSSLGLQLILDQRSGPQIESVVVTVYGVSSRLMALPAQVAPEYMVSKTFELHRSNGSESLRQASVSMSKVATLTRVELNAITYADGSNWHQLKDFQCQAVPSNFILVAGR
jgi:hypothetical protein